MKSSGSQRVTNSLVLIACLVLPMVGCNTTGLETGETANTNESTATAGFSMQGISVGSPATFENLTVFPLITKSHRKQDRFITLDEGLKSGLVDVLEGAAAAELSNEVIQQGNTVNTLYVVNRSDKHLYLMPGEILLGGDQDRMTSQESIIPPGSKPVAIAAFCVEQGRWGSRETAETVASLQSGQSVSGAVTDRSQSIDELAKQANQGKFIASVGNATKDIRAAGLLDKDQSKVWENVRKANLGNNTKSESDAFTRNYVDQQSINKIEPYLEKLLSSVNGTENVIGVVVAINGKIHNMDSFESTPLFQKLWPKLLKSYALDAITQQQPDQTFDACTVDQAKLFLNEMMQASTQQDEKHNGTIVAMQQSESGVCITSRVDRRQLKQLSTDHADADFAGGVHTSAFAK